jgi:pSer/pThr/pTyr-binding forkhead associated (FHA) protein
MGPKDKGKYAWIATLVDDEHEDIEETVSRFARMQGVDPNAEPKGSQIPQGLKAALEVVEGPDRELHAPITTTSTVIGRSMHAGLRVHDPTASRIHAVVAYNGEEFHITDNNSPNGTLVNGKAVQEAPLRDGDRVGIGDNVFVFRLTREEDAG